MLTFNMTDAQQAALTQLLIDLQDPSSPRYHQWLTPEQFGDQFGLSSTDISQVSSWLSSQGFTITGVGRASNYVTFSGTAGQVRQAFGTAIHSITVDSETHISNLSDPVLPAGIAAVVTNLSGLNDFRVRSRIRTRTVKPDFTSSITGTHYIAPGDFYTIYNENPLLGTSINGKGVTIAVMGETDINLSDVTAFRTASGLCTTVSSTCPNPLPTVKLIGSDPGISQGDLAEAMLDVEWAGAVAPNANILYVNTALTNNGGGVFSSLISTINGNLAPIISISYGACESDFGAASLASYNQFFQQANAQGQTIVGPSGDSGATDCDFSSYPAAGGLAVDFPASSPYVTSAGGSMFNEGAATGATTYWNSNSSSTTSNAGSALSYIPETVWNESSTTNGLGAGGGGVSAFFTKPYWQVGSTPADVSRDVPDISLNSASNHDGTLYCVSGSCVNGTFRAADGQSLSVVGGTSVAVPSFAGILALIEQRTGTRLGNIGPELYALASNATFNNSSSSSAFHDITTGGNTSACTAGTPNCPTGAAIGYSAGVGYDLATGWGSVNVYNLVNDWNLVTPVPPVVGAGTTLSTTNLTTANSPCGNNNANLAFSVKVSGTSPAITPTGTVQLYVDSTANGSPVALASGAATLTLSTGGLSSGSHAIYAVYSGDSTFTGSKGSVTTDVVSSTAPDFSLTPCAGAATANPGATAGAITFTVTPVNGFAGVVTFSATAVDAVNATYTFTPVTVTTSGTTSFVLSAYSSQAITANGLNRLGLNTAKQDAPRAPWYIPVSGASLACCLLLVLPRRRRWSALLAVVLSVAALGAAIGCGSNSVSTGGGSNSGGGSTTVNAAAGTYTIQVIATATTASGVVSHATNVTFNVP